MMTDGHTLYTHLTHTSMCVKLGGHQGLLDASKAGRLEDVKILIAGGANIEFKDGVR